MLVALVAREYATQSDDDDDFDVEGLGNVCHYCWRQHPASIFRSVLVISSNSLIWAVSSVPSWPYQ